MQYYSTKIIHLGSCAFRQPKAASHCSKLHGYRLSTKITFTCKELDENNWCVDFGSLKELKAIFENQFDHTTCISLNDPELETFKMLNEKGIVDLRVMSGVGIEKFAEFIFNTANNFIKAKTNNRCWVQQVEVWEHEQNSAGIVNLTIEDIKHAQKMLQEESQTQPKAEVEKQVIFTEEKSTCSIPQEITTQQPPAPNSAANPLYAKKSTGWSDSFKGTSWGNK